MTRPPRYPESVNQPAIPPVSHPSLFRHETEIEVPSSSGSHDAMVSCPVRLPHPSVVNMRDILSSYMAAHSVSLACGKTNKNYKPLSQRRLVVVEAELSGFFLPITRRLFSLSRAGWGSENQARTRPRCRSSFAIGFSSATQQPSVCRCLDRRDCHSCEF